MNDPEMRTALTRNFLRRYQRDQVLILQELGILGGESIVDLAILSKVFFQAIEIKSAQDSLTRLPRQIELYSKVFDYITIATQPSHLHDLLPIIPSYFGIILVTEDHYVDYYRPATYNPRTEAKCQVQLLWKEEVYDILKSRGIKGISKLNRRKLWKLLVELVTPVELKTLILERLRLRLNWKQGL